MSGEGSQFRLIKSFAVSLGKSFYFYNSNSRRLSPRNPIVVPSGTRSGQRHRTKTDEQTQFRGWSCVTQRAIAADGGEAGRRCKHYEAAFSRAGKTPLTGLTPLANDVLTAAERSNSRLHGISILSRPPPSPSAAESAADDEKGRTTQ